MMNKVERYKPTQTITPDQFILNAIDKATCNYCKHKQKCQMETKNNDLTNISNCPSFDNSINELMNIYKQQYTSIGT